MTVYSDALRWRAVRTLPVDLNGSLRLMCIQAIDEGDGSLPGDPEILLPEDMDEFLVLAKRVGIERGYAYRVYKKWLRRGAPSAREIDDQDLYRHFDTGFRLLYVGISGDLPTRETTHLSSSRWRELIAHTTNEQFVGRCTVVKAERIAIDAEEPLFNRQYNDTPEARERLRIYLEGIGRMDLMWD